MRTGNNSSAVLWGVLAAALLVVSPAWAQTPGQPSAASSVGCTADTAATAGACVKRDANANAFANNFVGNAQSIVTSATPVVLTAASPRITIFTGSTAQTVQLPDATTLTLGNVGYINNNSSAVITITNAGGSTLYTIPAGGDVQVNLLSIGTTNGSWDFHPLAPSIVSWGTGGSPTGLVMNNALTTTPAVSGGASSATAPGFIPQRATPTTGFGGDATHTYAIVGGATSFTTSATGVSVPSGRTYQVNGTQIGTTNLADVTSGSWTPTDASGAGLSFTGVSASYTKIGNMIFAYFNLHYPVTADASAALIGGLPVAVPAASYARFPGAIAPGSGTGVSYGLVNNSASTFYLYTSSNAQTPNSALSDTTISGLIIYPAS